MLPSANHCKPGRILVTGGAGFIGSHTIDLLLHTGWQVIVLDNLFSGKIENLPLHHPDLEFVHGDILEYPLVEDLLANCQAVLHLAAIVSVPYSIENPIYSFQVNTQGFLHVLQAIKKRQRSIRLVYASSAAVYGNVTSLPCCDEAPLSAPPLSPYALQKIQIEEYAHLYEQLFGIKSLGLRYFNAYGSRQDANSPYSGVISYFLDAYQNDKELVLFGDGQQSRDFIHVADIAKANLLALQSSYSGVLNVATGQAQTLLNLIEYIESAGGKLTKQRREPSRHGDIKHSYAAIALAEKQMGFKYSLSLKQGIQQLLKDRHNP
ncbi:MAG: NAD-dependent epimerase/dehydratase family protein [Gammaproteobacteria bacterium]|nr:NAD-dependent epimerase/dehydratase family protein [Gammaproteobacteria bacterium]